MTSKICKVNFHFFGNSPKDSNVRQEIIDEFVGIRSVLVKYTNPLVAKWNENYTGTELDDYSEDPEYHAYMNSMYKPWVNLINYMVPTKHIHLDLDERTDIIAKGINEDFTVRLTLEP